MEEEIRLLRKQLQIEVQANEESEAFLRRKHTQLQAEIGNWNQRYEEDYDGLATVCSGARHLFLPAPGSSGNRDHLFDAVFGL